MKELIKNLKELDYSKEFIEYLEKSAQAQDQFQIHSFDYENFDQTTSDSSELFLIESQEAQSDYYIVHPNN